MADVSKRRVRLGVSKNKKKSWRKFSDIKDVEAFLEEKRFDERTGGSIYEKPDEELFYLHTKKNEAGYNAKIHEFVGLKCHQSLTAYSKVKPPTIPPICGKKQNARIATDKERKLQKTVESLVKATKKTEKEQFHDLWDDEVEKKPDPEIHGNDYTFGHKDELLGQKPVKVPCHLFQKPSLLPAVEIPHAGASYNPAFDDHQELLRHAVVAEEKKLKDVLHLKRILTDMFPTKDEAPTGKTWMSEMSQGLFEEEAEHSNDVKLPHQGLVLSLNPPVTTETRKTKSQKRKAKELKSLDKRRIREKRVKQEINNVFRIRSLLSEIKKEEKSSQQNKEKREKREVDKLFKPRTLSSYKYEPNDLEVNLTVELPESLRGLKSEGNVLEDRFKSLQRRNIIETRMRQKRTRKYKLKYQVKRSHRDFMKATENE